MTGDTAPLVGALAAGALYAGLVAVTTPFTLAADVATAIPLALVLVPLRRRLVEGRATPAAPGMPTRRQAGARAWVMWGSIAEAAVAWQLFCYFSSPRESHPTLSALYDMGARHGAVKALVVLAWLALGRALVSR
jgi:hypothetical protein